MADEAAAGTQKSLYDIALQLLGAIAGIATVVYLLGATVMWVRVDNLGFATERIVGAIPRETLLALGIKTAVVWGGIAAILVGVALLLYYVAWPAGLRYVIRHSDSGTGLGDRAREAHRRRREVVETPAAPGEPVRVVRLAGPEVPTKFIVWLLVVSLLGALVTAALSNQWHYVVLALVGVPTVLVLLVENRRRVAGYGGSGSSEFTPERLETLTRSWNLLQDARGRHAQHTADLARRKDEFVRTPEEETGKRAGIEVDIQRSLDGLAEAEREVRALKADAATYEAWLADRKAKDATVRRPHVGLRFLQILVLTLYGGALGLAYVADDETTRVEEAVVSFMTPGAAPGTAPTEIPGILIAQTASGVHLGVPPGDLLFLPTSTIADMHATADIVETPSPDTAIIDRIGPDGSSFFLLVALIAIVALWAYGRSSRSQSTEEKAPSGVGAGAQAP